MDTSYDKLCSALVNFVGDDVIRLRALSSFMKLVVEVKEGNRSTVISEDAVLEYMKKLNK